MRMGPQQSSSMLIMIGYLRWGGLKRTVMTRKPRNSDAMKDIISENASYEVSQVSDLGFRLSKEPGR